MIREGIQAVVAGRNLTEAEAIAVMTEIMEGNASPAQIAAFIVGLRMKGETVEEITGCARVMRDKATFIRTPPESTPVDTAGTGGDGAQTFNISTTAAFVAAGAGVVMAKHGNRAASSKCGSADLLEALGINIGLEPAGIEAALHEVGMGFLFAPALHGAMRHAIGPRREIGVRTVFNILGPLTNPARAQHQLLGVARPEIASKMAAALKRLGCRHALVVHGFDGTDELSISGPTDVHEVRDGEIREHSVSPEDAGVPIAPAGAILGGTPEHNAGILVAVAQGEKGPLRDAVVLNAAAALVAADVAADVKEGAAMAEDAIDSGAARRKLGDWVEL